MKRPDKIELWLHTDKKENGFVNHLEKPLFDYTMKLPAWVGLAYKPFWVKVEIREKLPCWNDRREETNHKEIDAYVKENWMKKLTKMRKLNHNYMQVFTLGRDDPQTRQLSVEEYNEYHRELRELNEKYGVNRKLGTSQEETP